MANKSLGRGLSALFGEDNLDPAMPPAGGEPVKPKNGFRNLPLRRIEPNRAQPRRAFDETSLQELENSIRVHGVLAPITVRQGDNGYYQIVAGERRWRAARRAGLDTIPAMVIDADERTMMELALIENLQREDLNPVEEALGYRNLMELYGMTQEQIAETVSKSRPAIANALRLLALPEPLLEQLRSGALSAGHARALLSVEDAEGRQALADKIIAEGLSVRQAEELAKKTKKEEKTHPAADPAVTQAIRELENRASARVGNKVTIRHKSNNKGKVEINYYSVDELEKIIEILEGDSQR